MSIDYDVDLAAGFRIEVGALGRAFGARALPTTHEEPRWSPTTGEPVAPITVMDPQEGPEYALDGEEFKYSGDLAEAIASRLGCSVTPYAHLDGDVAYVFGPELETDDDGGLEDGRVCVGGGVAFAALDCAEFADGLRRVRAGLVGLGLEPGEALVAPVWRVG